MKSDNDLISASLTCYLKFCQISPKIVRRPPRDAPFLMRNTVQHPADSGQPNFRPLSTSEHNPSTQPAASAAPLFSLLGIQPSTQRTADKLSHCPTNTLAHQPTSTLAHYLTSSPVHFFLAREGFLVSAIQAVKSSGVTWSSLSAQGFHFSDFFRLWTMSSVFLPVCCSNRYARRIQ